MRELDSASVTCPSCGDVVVPIETVSVAMADRFWWLTKCPSCGRALYGRTKDGAVVGDLVANGAKVSCARVVDEAAEWLAAQVAR